MIYFVDEDEYEVMPFAMGLSNATKIPYIILRDADKAFKALYNANDIDVVIIDVMLATDINEESRYSAQQTNNFLTAGLALLDDLVENWEYCGKTCTPIKVILYSMAQQKMIVEEIIQSASKYNIAYLDKKDYDNVYSFVNSVQSIMERWNTK